MPRTTITNRSESGTSIVARRFGRCVTSVLPELLTLLAHRLLSQAVFVTMPSLLQRFWMRLRGTSRKSAEPQALTYQPAKEE